MSRAIVPTALAWVLWTLLGSVTIEIQIQGAQVAGRTVSASNEASSVQAVTDASGRAKLVVPPDAQMLLRIDGREAGDLRTPADGFHASVAIPWPPTFTVRLKGALPRVGAGKGGESQGAAAMRFRVVAIAAPGEVTPVETREVGLAADAIRVDWLLPGQRFDLYARAPGSAGEDWLWYAGPFLVEANAEETVVFRPAQHIALGDADDPETQRVLGVVAGQLQAYLAAHEDAEIEIEAHRDESRAAAVRDSLVSRGVDPHRIAEASGSEPGRGLEIRIQPRSLPAAPAPP